MCNTYIRTCILTCNINTICKWLVFCAHIPVVFQTINFTLQSSLHGIDFGLVQNGIIFYNCLVSERWTTLTASAHTHWYRSFSLHSWSVSFSCSSCTSRFNCNWCPVEFQCRTSGADCIQSPVVSVCAALVHLVYLHSGTSARLVHLHSFLPLYLSSVHLLILPSSPACLDWWW